jgi:hypothetical protein
MKSLHYLEEACFMGFSGGFEQGKPETALPDLVRNHSSYPKSGQFQTLGGGGNTTP